MNKKLVSYFYQEGKREFIKNTPSNDILYDLAHEKGQELAGIFKANFDIVAVGTSLMDYKIADAISMGKINDHIKMSAEASKLLLLENNVDEATISNIVHCIEAHHGNIPYNSIESEICANADCYKFIHPKGFFSYLITLSRRIDDFSEILKQAESKLDEKYNILSLEYCKNELNNNYNELKKLITLAQKN